MLDGMYQSVICFFMAYLLFAPAASVTESGQDVSDQERMGVYIACATVVVVNVYVLLNTYRWDWLMLLLVAFSILLIWFWTGVYSAFSSSSKFYKAAPQVYGSLTFWALSLLVVIICLLPRFSAKAFQKIYLPRDVDIIREQIRRGGFNHLEDGGMKELPSKTSSTSFSDLSRPVNSSNKTTVTVAEDERPIYPPSVAATGTSRNPRSQNGSDGTDYTGHDLPLDRPVRASFDRPRPSFDRIRSSMERVRPSYEASNDFTSAALLTRVESSHSDIPTRRNPHGTSSLR